MATSKKHINNKSSKSSIKPERKKPVAKKRSVSASKQDQAEADNILSQALMRYKAEIVNDQKAKFKEITHLGTIAEEYLSSFVIIGYSLQNEKVVVFNTPSPKDEAALVDLLRSTFIEIASNRP